jgi:hypothetical protein
VKQNIRWTANLIFGIIFLGALGLLVYYMPPVHDRLAWRVAGWRTQLHYALNPPDREVFVPQEQVAAVVRSTLQALTPTAIPLFPTQPLTVLLTPTATQPGPSPTPRPSVTSTLSPTPMPDQVALTGIRHEYQSFNNCGPATLSMALSYWSWSGIRAKPEQFCALIRTTTMSCPKKW